MGFVKPSDTIARRHSSSTTAFVLWWHFSIISIRKLGRNRCCIVHLIINLRIVQNLGVALQNLWFVLLFVGIEKFESEFVVAQDLGRRRNN
jgi:hypothetical protein